MTMRARAPRSAPQPASWRADGRHARTDASRKSRPRNPRRPSEEAAQAAQQQQVDTFKRGLGACLEGRGYTVK